MNTKTCLAVALAAMALASCKKNNDHAAMVAAEITASIGSVQTRAAGSAWAQGDAIGISTVAGTKTEYANIPYKYDGAGFNPDGTVIYFQSDDEVTFNAYYPFEGAAGSSAGTVTANTGAANQTAAAQPAIDFLFACGAKAAKTNPRVAFTDKSDTGGEDNSFRHRMSQITLKLIEGDDILFENMLTSYTLGGLRLDGTFNTEDGEAAADAEAAPEDLTIGLTGATATAKTFTTAPVILFPQTVTGGKIAVEIIVEGEPYKADLAITALEPGRNHIFPVTVKKTGLSVGDPEIKDWVEVNGTSTDATM